MLRISSETGGKLACRRDWLLHSLVVRREAPSAATGCSTAFPYACAHAPIYFVVGLANVLQVAGRGADDDPCVSGLVEHVHIGSSPVSPQ
jgi:hypothetical protein